jgi:hypothetical protein
MLLVKIHYYYYYYHQLIPILKVFQAQIIVFLQQLLIDLLLLSHQILTKKKNYKFPEIDILFFFITFNF